jgi:hypothetical protein
MIMSASTIRFGLSSHFLASLICRCWALPERRPPKLDGPPTTLDNAQNLPLRLPEQNSVEATTGAGDVTQYRTDVANRSIGTRLQDDGHLSTGQWCSNPGGLQPICGAVPTAKPVWTGGHCNRRKQFQSSEQPDRAGRRQHRALSCCARSCRSRSQRRPESAG